MQKYFIPGRMLLMISEAHGKGWTGRWMCWPSLLKSVIRRTSPFGLGMKKEGAHHGDGSVTRSIMPCSSKLLSFDWAAFSM